MTVLRSVSRRKSVLQRLVGIRSGVEPELGAQPVRLPRALRRHRTVAVDARRGVGRDVGGDDGRAAERAWQSDWLRGELRLDA